MAFEFFDDVAFYYVVQSILALFLLPMTVYYACTLLYRSIFGTVHFKEAAKCACPTCAAKFREAEAIRNHWRKQITPCRVIYIILLLFFVIGISQLHHFQTDSMIQFDPYSILEITESATDKEITKAYRKLSLLHHPDKGGDEQTFMLITKAHKILTDETAKRNFDKFGNTDGYQGASVTIGLPSFLTKKENEMKVMFVYVLVLLIIPPIAVGIWYSKSKQFHESGVMHQTLRYYYMYIQEGIMLKNLIEVLAMSHEYFPLNTMPLDTGEFKKLNKELSEDMGKFKFAEKAVYLKRAVVMFYAHMMRKEIVASLKPDLHFVLERAHKLLEAMFEMTLSRRFFKPVADIFTLTQLITQGMWREDSPLIQLPHVTEQDIKRAHKKKINTLNDLRAFMRDTSTQTQGAGEEGEMSGEAKRLKVFKEMTPTQWKEIDDVLQVLPRVAVEYSYEVEGEEGLVEGDFVLLTVKLNRVPPEVPDMPAPKLIKKPVGGEEEGSTSPKPEHNGEGLGLTQSPDDDSESSVLQSRKELDKEMRKKESKWTEEEWDTKIWDASITPDKKKAADLESVPYVHSARLPFPKQEKWICYLIEGGSQGMQGGRIVALVKVPNFVDQEEVELRFRPGKAGKQNYELHLRCDSYVGVDVVENFKVDVGKAKSAAKTKVKRLAGAKEGDDEASDESEDEDEEEEVELPGKWYYLQGTTLLEGLLNWVALVVMLVMLQNFLQTRGLWDPYVKPIQKRLMEIWMPFWTTVHGVIGPVYDPAVAAVYKALATIGEFLTRELPEEALRSKTENFQA
eukprot:gb/GEZN01002014.1/.p1 GENE.gb/GEZN01002014.1/~~gb/GEZN01002014.1/.p1  ORF type:complete len:794 (-),score=185.41 gb/GEZN01002014.1/:208-2589(-)